MDLIIFMAAAVIASIAFVAGGVQAGRDSVTLPEIKQPDEKTLERWHDAYDAAALEGCDVVECVARADAEIKPKPVEYHNQPWADLYPVPTPLRPNPVFRSYV